MNKDLLETIARRMGEEPGGILAADESLGTMKGRLVTANIIPNTSDPRAEKLACEWRDIIANAPLRSYVNGVILSGDQLARRELVKAFKKQAIMVGAKIDQGLAPFAGSDVEEVTQGLNGVDERIALYPDILFTKFRSFLHIDSARGYPSIPCIEENARIQAAFAWASQQATAVPMVEPEVDMKGSHSILECAKATTLVLNTVFGALRAFGVYLPGIVLKPNMVTSGTSALNRASPEDVARATLDVLKVSVPSQVPVIAFLSGGQGDEEACANLNAINVLAKTERVPWRLTYSFGRGAQNAAREKWGGEPSNIRRAQEILVRRMSVISAASMGRWQNAG